MPAAGSGDGDSGGSADSEADSDGSAGDSDTEGARLVIQPEVTQDDWTQKALAQEINTPEAIEVWLKWYDSLEPLIITPEEEADLAAWREKVKQYAIAQMDRDSEELFE